MRCGHSSRAPGSDWSTCWHARPVAANAACTAASPSSFPAANRTPNPLLADRPANLASHWLADNSGSRTFGGLPVPAWPARCIQDFSAAVATACGSSRSLEQLPSANKAAGWKEEAEVAADGGVHQAGRVGDADVPAKPCLVPLGPAALSASQTGQGSSKQEILCKHNSWQWNIL